MGRKRRLSALVAAVIVLGSLLAPGGGASPATRLPFGRFGELVHDVEHRRVFVTGPTDGSRIAVLNYEGRLIKTIQGLQGPAEMTLHDGSLYVSLYLTNTIAVIDPVALRVIERIDITPYNNPLQMARTGNYLWVSVDCESSIDAKLIAIDLTTGEIYEYPPPYSTGCAHLLGSPTEDDVLFTWEEDISETDLRKYRIEPSPLPIPQAPEMTLEATTRVPDVRDAQVSADGEHLYFASQMVRVIRTSDLVQVRTYPDGYLAADVTTDEEYVVGGEGYPPDLYVYRGDRTVPVYKTAMPSFVGEGGIAVIDDAARVLVVTDDLFGKVALRVIVPWFSLRSTKRQEVGPAGYQGALAWSQTDAPASRRFNAFVERDGRTVKVNRDGTDGVVGGFDTGLVSYTESKGRRANVFLYDVNTSKRRDPGRKVNTRATEYLPGVSGPWLLFGRYTNGGRGRKLLLYNRETRRIKTLDSVSRRRSVLVPGQMNGPWAAWFTCDRQCTVFRYNVKTRRKTRVPRAKRTRDVAASVAPDGTVYFSRAGPRCGRNVRIMRVHPGGRPAVIRQVPAGIEVTATFYSESPDRDELLIGRLDCQAGQLDILKSHEP